MKEFDEAGALKRFLHRYAEIKKKYLFTDLQFGQTVGSKTPKIYIYKLKTGKTKLDLFTLMNAHLNYPDIDINYILHSSEIPEETEVPNLTGIDFHHKSGRKPIDNPKQPRKPRKSKRQLTSYPTYATYA